MMHHGFRSAHHGWSIAISVLVLVGLSTSACTSSTSSAPSSSPVTTATEPAGTAHGSMVDIDTGKITPLPASIATSGTYYAVSPDHTTVAYNACCAQPGPVMAANLDGTQVRPLTDPGWDAYGAQWSPDGSLLVYQQRHATTNELGNLFVLDVKTGQQTQITNFDQTKQWDWWFTFPSFSYDAPFVLFQLPRGDNGNPAWDLWMVPVTGGEPLLLRHDAGWVGSSSATRRLGSRYPSYGAPYYAYLSPVNKDDFTGGGLWIASHESRMFGPPVLVRNGHLDMAEVVPGWDADLLLGGRIDLRAGRRNQFG